MTRPVRTTRRTPADRIRGGRARASFGPPAVVLGASAFFFAAWGALAPCAWGGGPEAVPEATWWGVRMTQPLRERPLRVLEGTAGAELEGEWSPLYRDGDGALVEGTRRAVRIFGSSGAWHGAAEAEDAWAAARGGGDRLRLGAEEFRARRGTVAFGRAIERGGISVAASVEHDLPPGFGVAAFARPLPGARFEAGATQAHVRGALSVSWDDTEVRAPGRWLERRAHWRIEADPGRTTFALGQEALDQRGAGGGDGDQVEPWLGWRETRAAVSAGVRGIAVVVDAAHGDGFQATRVRRDGMTYANAEGPVRRDAVEVTLGPSASTLRLRGWAGRWTGDGAGVLSLWPFEPLTALTGTRRAARSSASLSHRGLALEREVAGRPGWRAGVALWALAPRADYSTWQTTLFGLGRDDYSEGESTLEEALLLGVKLGETFEWAGVRLSLDAVQWLPVRVRETESEDGGSSGGGGTGGATAPDAGSSTRGGTVLRIRVGAGR